MQNDVRLEPVTSPFAVTDAALESVEFPQIHDAFDNAHMAYMYIQMYAGQISKKRVQMRDAVEGLLNIPPDEIGNSLIADIARNMHQDYLEQKNGN